MNETSLSYYERAQNFERKKLFTHAANTYLHAIAAGENHADHKLRELFKKHRHINFEPLFELYLSAANAGDASAAYLLAKAYELSEKNFTLAAYWYQKSAEAGYLSAQFTLGQLFASYTNVVPHNKKLAVFCLRKSADRHHPEAGNELNQCLRNGYVSNNCRSEALEYRKDVELRHAHFAKKILLNDAQLGIFESRYHYGMISLSAKGVMRDEPQKFNTTLRADTLTDNKKRLLFLNQLMTQEHALCFEDSS